MSEPEPEPSAAQLIEEIKKLRVSDLVLSTVTTLAQLGYAKLEEPSRDLEQARLAIDTIRALLPTLEGHLPVEAGRELAKLLADLQVAYAAAASGPPVE